MTDFNILLFDDFETLDAFGPAEIIGRLTASYTLDYFSSNGGIVTSRQKVQVHTRSLEEMPSGGVLLIPGGMGTRTLVTDEGFIRELTLAANSASYVLTVCTGSALLAKTGLLNNRQATSNKRAFDWVKSVNDAVAWVSHARWVVDGPYYTSSGVSAGMDMTLGFIADLFDPSTAQSTADSIEYIWNSNKDFDPFSVEN